MLISDIFPHIALIHLERRVERLLDLLEHFDKIEVEFDVARIINAPDGSTSRKAGSYGTPAQRAHGLAFRKAIMHAKRNNWPSVLILEDDVRFGNLNRLKVPDDWELFYLGCQHFRNPIALKEGSVRVMGAYDTHAVAIRSVAYDAVLEVLKRSYQFKAPTDVRMSFLHPHRRCYAAYPNLAWQHHYQSDIQVNSTPKYDHCGHQLRERHKAVPF